MRRTLVLALGLGLVAVAAMGAVGFPRAQKKTHLGDRASSLVSFWANVSVGSNQPLQLIGPDGSVKNDFTLPEDTVLVVTDLVVSPNITPRAGLTRGGLINDALNGASNPYFSFDATKQANQTIHLTSGTVWTQVPRVVNAQDSANAVFVQVYGYLVRNK